MMSFRTARSLAMAFVLAATCAAALAAAQEQLPRRRRSRVAERHGDGGHGGYVSTLVSDFEVYEDGARQTITFFSRVQQPIALALPASARRRNERLEHAQEAAIGFAKRMRKEDAIEVIDFDSQVRILQTFTNDVAALERAIRGTDVNGSTSLYNAVYISLKELKKAKQASAEEIRRAGHRRALGRRRHLEPRALRRGARPGEAVGDSDLRDRPASGRRASHRVQGSGVRVKSSCPRRPRGRAYFVQSAAELPKIYEQISEELANQYSIAYSSKNPMRNGAWRRIVVRVARLEDLARTRQGYYGPESGRRRAALDDMHLVPCFHSRGRRRLPDALRARATRAPAGSGLRSQRRHPGVHVPHRHVDGEHRARATGRHHGGRVRVRVAARPLVSLHRADDRRARHGRVRRADPRRALHHPGARPGGEPAATAPAESASRCTRLDALRLRELRAGVRARADLRALVQGDQGEAPRFYARPPSLQALDAMNARVVTVGWLFLTLGIAIGGIWATQIQTSSDLRAQAMGLGDPKILAALLCWGHLSSRCSRAA